MFNEGFDECHERGFPRWLRWAEGSSSTHTQPTSFGESPRYSRRGIRSVLLSAGLTAKKCFVTHDQEEALTLSDRIAVLSQGRLQQLGSPTALYEKPYNPFVADFIGINNLIPGKVKTAVDSGSRLVVDSAAGPIACAGDGRLKPGVDCMVCIRPETAELSLSQTFPDGFSSIAGTVSFPSYIGNTIRYDVDVAGITFKVDIQNPRDHQLLPVGTKVFIHFPATSSLGIPVE